MIRTGVAVWATTAAATLPCRCPSSPLRRCGPSTIRLASCSSAASTMPFQVGVASTAMLRARNPALSASDAPCAAVRSAACRTSTARSASKCLRVSGREPDLDGLPDAHDHRVSLGRQLRRGMRDRELGELGSVVGEDHRPGSVPQRRAVRCRGARGRLDRDSRAGRPGRSRASSGGEYQAGDSPSMNSSRSGRCGRAPLSTIDRHTEDRAADREAETDPERIAGAGVEIGRGRAAKCAKSAQP